MLLLMGFIYSMIGVALFFHAQPLIDGSFLNYWPNWLQALVWWIAAAFAFVNAFRHHDEFGWLALYIPPSIRVIAYVGSLLYYVFPGGKDGSLLALLGAVNSSAVVGAVIICSGWEEPNRQRLPGGDDDDGDDGH